MLPSTIRARVLKRAVLKPRSRLSRTPAMKDSVANPGSAGFASVLGPVSNPNSSPVRNVVKSTMHPKDARTCFEWLLGRITVQFSEST